MSKYALGVMSAVLALSFAASANEGMGDIQTDKARKEAVVSFLQARIEKHQSMTQQEIVADFQASAVTNTAKIQDADVKAKFSARMNSDVAQYASLDKETIIEMEKASLQEVMTAGNLMFILSRINYEWAVSYRQGPGWLVLQIFTIPLDLLALPYTFIVSACTGF